MRRIDNRKTVHSATKSAFYQILFLLLFIILVDSTVFRSPFADWQCRILFSGKLEHTLEVKVDCEGKMKISRKRSFTGLPETPWEVFPGFQVFGATQDGYRTLILLSEVSLRLVNSSFPKDLITLPSTISGPITLINSTLAIQSSTFFVSDFAQYSGGILSEGNSVLTVENCAFFGNLNSPISTRAGAIFATEGSLLTIVGSTFQNILSKEAAISVKEGSIIRLSNNKFIQNNGGEGSAILVRNAELISVEECLFSLCTSSLYASLSLIDSRRVEIKLSNFSNNFGKSGGALHVSHTSSSQVSVDIYKSCFVNNRAVNSGGGVYLTSTTAVVSHSLFDFNTADKNGGGLYIQETTKINMKSCILINNLATLITNAVSGGCGAGMFAERVANLIVENTTFTKNSAIRSGGAGYFKEVESAEFLDSYIERNRGRDHAGIAVHGGALWIMKDSVMQHNKAESHTGALYLRHTPTLLFANVEFFNNSADLGGAVFINNGTGLQMKNSQLRNNFALKGSGGALRINKVRKVDLYGTRFISNVAESQGGALYAESISKQMIIDSSYFEKNSAQKGGASLVRNVKFLKVKTSTLVSNHANMGNGGALLLQGYKSVVVSRSNFVSNQAKENGGAFCILSPETLTATRLTLKNAKFVENRVEFGSGGGLYCERASDVKILESEFRGNTGLAQGGAVMVVHGEDTFITSSLFENNSLLLDQSGSHFASLGSVSAPVSNPAVSSDRSTNLRDDVASLVSSTKNFYPARSGDPVSSQNSGILLDVSRADTRDAAAVEDRSGGALMISNTAKVTLESSVFTGNTVPGKGGAFYSDKHGLVSIQDVHFLENKAGIGGGAISVHQTDLTLYNLEFRSNQGNRGGSMEINAGNMIAERIQTTRNHAMSDAGVIFCEETSYVHFNLSRFANDDSENGTAFLAGCGCQLTVLYSEMKCTDPEAKGCGLAKSAEHCAASVMFLYPGKPEKHKTQPADSKTAIYRTEALEGRKTLPEAADSSTTEMRRQSGKIDKSRNRWVTFLLVLFGISLTVVMLSLLRLCLTGRLGIVVRKKENQRSALQGTFNEQSDLSATLFLSRKDDQAPLVISLKDG